MIRSPAKATSNDDQHKAAATENLFELLERVQSSRLDDQRCVLPAYFSQVNGMAFEKSFSYVFCIWNLLYLKGNEIFELHRCDGECNQV